MILSAASACGSNDPLPLPDVVGQQLDEAYSILEDGGFEEVRHTDSIEGRSVFSRSNWVVLDQEPSGGDYLDKDTEILLQVAKPEDSGLRSDQLPDDSPLLAQVVEREEREARQQQEKAAEQQQEVQEFVEKIDPSARVAQVMFSDLGDLRDEIEASGGLTYANDAQLSGMELPIKALGAAFAEPPASIDSDAARVENAVQQFGRAVATLKSARGPAVAGAVERFDQIYSAAVEEYNEALASIYEITSVTAPTV